MVFIIIFRLIFAFLVNFKLSFRLKRLEFLLVNIKCKTQTNEQLETMKTPPQLTPATDADLIGMQNLEDKSLLWEKP